MWSAGVTIGRNTQNKTERKGEVWVEMAGGQAKFLSPGPENLSRSPSMRFGLVFSVVLGTG